MDATEILKSNAAAAAAADAAWVNPRDPAKAVGADGLPLRSRRAPKWADVPNEQWDDWRWQLSNRVNSLEEIGEILELTADEREGLSAEGKFRVDITPYFISLIDPKDPNDPIRRQVIPVGSEQQAFTAMMEDSLGEDRHSPVPGLVHRYPDRVLMLVTTQCASYCRYCTRSRIVGDPTQNFNSKDHEAQLDYLRRTPQVRDVLISGGDGLTLAPKLFEKILRGLRDIPHIEIIRIGSRVPVFMPQRIDDELCEMLAKYHHEVRPEEIFENVFESIGREPEITTLETIDIQKLTQPLFEVFVSALYTRLGYETHLTPADCDKGADVIALGNNENILLLTNASGRSVGVQSVEEVLNARNYYENIYNLKFKCVVFSRTTINNAGIEFAKKQNVGLVDFKKISEFLQKHPISMNELLNHQEIKLTKLYL